MNEPESAAKKVNADLIRRYNVSGPRYTSYPTALQFAPYSESDFKEAVAASRSALEIPSTEKPGNANDDLSVYVHIPFCATLCYYCACNKIVTKKREPAIEYLALLKQELAMVAPLFEGRVVSQLHWGGGTPTFFDDDQLLELMDALKSAFDFRSDDEGEFGIEIDPRTVDAERVAYLRKCGFNRLSFGIQDFNPVVQKAVNRIQTYEQTEEILEAARANGFESISVDLIYGLPHQSVSSFDETLKQIIELRPDRVSIFNYAHLPERFSPQKRILISDLPGPDEKLDILGLCIERLTSAGYVYIGMDHFALPDDELAVAQREGTLHRNFQGYSTYADCDLLALGVTGISNIGNTYSQNVKELDAYREKLVSGSIPVEKGVMIDNDDQIRKAVINALICQFELDFEKIEHAFGIDFQTYFANELDTLKPMVADELLAVSPGEIKVLESGRLLIRNICMVFDRYITSSDGTQAFSKAI